MSEVKQVVLGKPVADATVEVRAQGIKPRLRGIPDIVAILFLLPLTVVMMVDAQPGVATLAAAIYGASIVLMFAVSATYHTPYWSKRVRHVWRALDHSMIYVFIAGSYTPACLLALPSPTGEIVLGIVWAGAAFGILKSFAWPNAPRVLNTSLYILMGWLIVPFVPTLFSALGLSSFLLLAAGGLSYTLGAVVYVRRKPNPWPQTFGYHEVFHLFVIGAAGCHLAAMWTLVS